MGAQFVQRAEEDAFRRARLGARRGQPAGLPVVAEGAFERAARVEERLLAAVDHAERARHHAVAAAVANVVLHQHAADFRADDRAGGAASRQPASSQCLHTSEMKQPAERVFVRGEVGEHVTRHRAGELPAARAVLFDEEDVPPGRSAERVGVVVGIARPAVAVVGHVVPFLARDLARLAADAHGRVGVEADRAPVAHVGVLALVGGEDAFADHRKTRLEANADGGEWRECPSR